MTVKYGKEKTNLSNKKSTQPVQENEKESRELERLIEYGSESSFNETQGEILRLINPDIPPQALERSHLNIAPYILDTT